MWNPKAPTSPAPTPPAEKLLLGLVLAAALGLRLLPASDALPYLHDWDEPLITATALHLLKTGESNPGFFHYGSLTLYLQAAVDVAHYFYLMGRAPIPFDIVPGIYDHPEIDLEAIETWHDTGWLWSVSHPSFVLWNRGFTAILGAATVLIAFLLGRRLAGGSPPERWTALLAAAFLAVEGFHVERSALANPEVLMTLLALATVLASTAFVERPGAAPWLVALAMAGLATATKLNAGLVAVAPAAALTIAVLHPRTRHRVAPWMLLALPVVPALSFLAASPWALLDLPSFLAQAGFELHHYAGRGHAAVDVEPGWPHLALQGQRLLEHFGPLGGLLALGGAAVATRRRAGLVAVFFPALHVLYMATTRVAFQRNLLVVYPLVAVLAAVGAVRLARWTSGLPGRRGRLATGAVAVAVTALLGHATWQTASAGWTVRQHRETRSQAIDAIIALASGHGAAPFRVGLAAELRWHRLDLERLAVSWDLAPHLELVCHPERFDLVVTGARHVGLWPSRPDAKRLARRIDEARLEVERQEIPSPPWGSPAVRIDGLSEDPSVLLHLTRRRPEGRPAICDEPATPGEP